MDMDAVLAQDLDRMGDFGHRLVLLHPLEALGIERFEADVQRVAARLFHQPDELGIAGDVGPDLGRPGELEPLPDHGLQKGLGPLPVGREIVIVEKNEFFRSL